MEQLVSWILNGHLFTCTEEGIIWQQPVGVRNESRCALHTVQSVTKEGAFENSDGAKKT